MSSVQSISRNSFIISEDSHIRVVSIHWCMVKDEMICCYCSRSGELWLFVQDLRESDHKRHIFACQGEWWLMQVTFLIRRAVHRLFLSELDSLTCLFWPDVVVGLLLQRVEMIIIGRLMEKGVEARAKCKIASHVGKLQPPHSLDSFMIPVSMPHWFPNAKDGFDSFEKKSNGLIHGFISEREGKGKQRELDQETSWFITFGQGSTVTVSSTRKRNLRNHGFCYNRNPGVLTNWNIEAQNWSVRPITIGPLTTTLMIVSWILSLIMFTISRALFHLNWYRHFFSNHFRDSWLPSWWVWTVLLQFWWHLTFQKCLLLSPQRLSQSTTNNPHHSSKTVTF